MIVIHDDRNLLLSLLATWFGSSYRASSFSWQRIWSDFKLPIFAVSGKTDKIRFIKKLVQFPPYVSCVFVFSAGSDFCANRESGTYPDPEDCAGFIVCKIGKEHRQKCASPQLFQADTMNCDLPERVDCGTRPRRYGLTKRFHLINEPQVHYSPYMRPAIGANPGKMLQYFKAVWD